MCACPPFPVATRPYGDGVTSGTAVVRPRAGRYFSTRKSIVAVERIPPTASSTAVASV